KGGRPSSETCLECSPGAQWLWGTLSAARRLGAGSLWLAESCAVGPLQPRGAPESDRSPNRPSFLGTVRGGTSGWPRSRGPALTLPPPDPGPAGSPRAAPFPFPPLLLHLKPQGLSSCLLFSFSLLRISILAVVSQHSQAIFSLCTQPPPLFYPKKNSAKCGDLLTVLIVQEEFSPPTKH
ncbi:hypothetical protein H1C71_004304, partial [Ictidomys tridecemlineatus]